MAEAVGSAAAAVAQILTNLPDIGRKLVRWQDVRSENPIRLPALLEDITYCQNMLTTVMSIYENLERDPSVQLPHTAPIVKLQVSNLQRNFDRAKQDCERLNPSRTTFLLYPNELCNKITSVAEDVGKLNIAMGELKHDLQPQPVPGPSDAVQERFVVVNNVPHNPPDVYLDFDSKDENGNPRTHEAQLKNAIFNEDDRSAIGVVARGGGGVGKTCALRGIGLLEETKKRFTGGILYMTIGADGGLSRLIESIAEIVEKAGSQHKANRIRDKNTLSEAASIAGEWFQHAACLFLVDDIWCVNGIAPESVHELRTLARRTGSRVAFTARDTNVDCGRKIVFRERPQHEEQAHCILLRCADMLLPTSAEAIEAFNGILKLCNGLPIALSVCGRAVKHYATERCARCPEDAWVLYLQRYGDQAVLSTNDGEGIRRMRESVLLSLDLIDEELGMTISRTWFKALCVLQKQQVVRSDVLRRLWSVSNDMSDRFIDYIERFGIAQIKYGGNDKGMLIGLHDVLLNISRELAAEGDELRQWSTTLIVSYANSSCCNTSQSDRGTEVFDGFQEWWMGVEDDGYIFQNICRLLMIATSGESLLCMMTSADWIIKQLLKNGHRQVQEDIEVASKYIRKMSTGRREVLEPVRDFLKALHNAVQLSAKRVRESEWNGMAWFEVYGRLVHLQEKNEVVRRFVEKVQDKAPRPWLKPSAGCLAPAGESLRHVMELGSPPLCQIEANSIVLACYEDARSVYIKRYDTQTGVESSSDAVLSDISEVRCAAFSSSGEYLAVGLHDGRIVICSLADCRVASAHEDSGSSRQHERSDAAGESEMSEEGENTKCGIMGWRHIFRWGCFGRKERGEGREVEGDRGCEGRISDKCSGRGSSRDEDVCSTDHLEYVRGGTANVRSIAVSNDGRHVVSGSDDYTVCVWEMDGDKWVNTVLHRHNYIVTSVSMNGDGTRLASGSADKTVRVSEKDGDKWVSAVLHGHNDSVRSVSMNGDGTRLASGSCDKTVRLWENDGDKWVNTAVHGHDDYVRCVSMNGDGTRIASGSDDYAVCVWEKEGGKWVSAVLHGHGHFVNCVSMNEDGTRVVSGSEEKNVRVWEKDGGNWVSAVLHGHDDTVRSISMNGDGTRVASGSDDHTVRVWEKDGEEWISTVLHGHGHFVNCVSMNGDGTRVASGSWDKTVRVWEKDDDEWVCAVLREHEHSVSSVSMSGDGERIASKDSSGHILSWVKQEGKWVIADDGGRDTSLNVSHLAGENFSWKGQVSHELYDEVIRPLATIKSFPTAFGYFITIKRKPYIAQIDIIH